MTKCKLCKMPPVRWVYCRTPHFEILQFIESDQPIIRSIEHKRTLTDAELKTAIELCRLQFRSDLKGIKTERKLSKGHWYARIILKSKGGPP